MTHITHRDSYKSLQRSSNILMNELIEVLKQGDSKVHRQITALSKIIKLIDILPYGQPWEQIGVSRSTYYRDLHRAKVNDKEHNGDRADGA